MYNVNIPVYNVNVLVPVYNVNVHVYNVNVHVPVYNVMSLFT